MEFYRYTKRGHGELTPWTPHICMDGITVSDEHRALGHPMEGDMIARHPDNHDDRWLVVKHVFEANYDPGSARRCPS